MWFTRIIRLRRYNGPNVYTDGFIQKSSYSDSFIEASIQPVGSKDQILSPVGDRISQSYKIYSQTKLKVGDEQTGVRGDSVLIDDEEFKVLHVESYALSPFLPYYKSIIQRVDIGGI